MTREQHIAAMSAQWEKEDGGSRTLAEYMLEYSHITDLYERICSDLGEEPLP